MPVRKLLATLTFISIVLSIAACLGTPLAFAQIQNPLQAARDAYKQARQQQQKGHQQTATPPASSPQPEAQGSSSSASSGDCCSPEAMKKIAASDSFLDIVGIKLGMTPEQAVAAIKAHNPKLKIDIFNTRLQHPGETTFTRVPLWVVAHTVSPVSGPNFFADRNGSAESIGVEFTTPPNPPMVGKVFRWVQFPRDQPVAGPILVDALHKKYGSENSADSIRWTWIFDANGKQLTRFLTPAERLCHENPESGFPLPLTGGNDYGDTRDKGSIDLESMTMNEQSGYFDRARGPACQPYAFVVATNILLQGLSTDMMVSIQSPGLFYISRKAAHDWLQGEADAIVKQQNDAGAHRSAPKL